MGNNESSRESMLRTLLVIGGLIVVASVVALGLAGDAPAQQASVAGQSGAGDGSEYQDPTQFPAYFRSGPHLPGYDFVELPLDPDSPFYPSSASTRSGSFYSQEQLMDVERCGDAGCHPDIYDMWFESTHHLASMSDPWYQRTVKFMQDRAGIRTSQWCAGCHDPALMMTGVMQREEPIDMGSAASNIGLSCQFCHSVDQIHAARANGSFRLAPAAALPYAGTTDPVLRELGNRELLASPDLIGRHKARRRSYFHGLSEFCGTCHKQSLITPVNNYKWFRGFDEYDGWQNSGVSGAAARSFYQPEEPMRCQTCHMPEVPSNDAGNDNGYVNSHRFLGSNTALPAFHGYDAQLRATVEFLRDNKLTVDLFAVRLPTPAGNQALVAPADRHVLAVAPGIEVGVEVVVRTRNVGHQFTGGTTDSNMSWLELSVLDAAGSPVLMSGGMDDDSFVDADAHFYRGLFLDEAGQELSKRNGWDRRTPVYVRQIPPGAADVVHFRFTVPDGTPGPLKVRARLNYRKHKQSYNRWVFGATPKAEQPEGAVSLPAVDTRAWDYDDSLVPDLPVVVLADDELILELTSAGARVDGAALEGDLVAPTAPDWMRFNDYGIGLLLQSDLRASARAFRWVQQVRPDYADGLVNEARAHLQEGNLPEAESVLERAFAVQPDFYKATYFMSQVDLAYGEYERAVELLERVAEQFPFDRVVRLDLGHAYYLLGRHDEAVRHLLFVLDNIDPEELGAHYNLMLAYRALGDTAKADVHEARYLRYRDDEDIRSLSGPYKRANPADNREAQPIHVHDLLPPGARFSAPERYPWTDWLRGGAQARPVRVYPGPTPPWQRTDRPELPGGR